MLSLNFSSCNPFPSKPSADIEGCKLFQYSDITIVNKKWNVIFKFPTTLIDILAVQKFVEIIDKAPLTTLNALFQN